MNVVMLSPGYPPEMQRFTRGLASIGVDVIGVGDSAKASLPEDVRHALAAYIRVDSMWDEAAMAHTAREIASRAKIHRIECLWEPGMVVAARMREAVGVPGLRVEQTIPFRDKEIMKQVLDRAGIRTPRHASVTTTSAAREAAERIGFPVIVKPIAGAGAIDTYRADDPDELERALARTRHVPELSVEEFVDGDEFTFDTVCVDGRPQFVSMSWYRPRPLDGKLHEWVSPQAIVLRNLDDEFIAQGKAMGFAVLEALGFREGFTHMEWYRKADGEAVFGEIGARPPGANMTELMNYAHDTDVYRGWAEAVCTGRYRRPTTKKYNCAIIFKRAMGDGRIQRIEGLDGLQRRFGQHIVKVDLLPVGAMRRDWKQVQISDGYLIVRHPELQTTLAIADAVGHDLRLYAG